MKARWLAKGASVIAVLAATAAFACADGGCEGGFSLVGKSYSCRGRAMLAPGNDSRLNLMQMLADRGGRSTAGLTYPDAGSDYNNLGQVFVDWRMYRQALFPKADEETAATGQDYAGSRCAGFAAGSAALSAAMQANRALPPAERDALLTARGAAQDACKQSVSWERRYGDAAKLGPLPSFGQWPTVSSAAGRDFLAYLQAADAFYGERFDVARSGFAGLARANDPWLRETAAYLTIRVEFAAAQAPAFDEYGSYAGGAKVDRAAVKRGLEALAGYLKAWPQGRYAASAQGLLRRGLWLAGDYQALAATYARMTDAVSPQQEAAALLVEEVDTKFLFNPESAAATSQGALLLATQDLIALRDGGSELTAAALEAQAPRFAGAPRLFGYLQASQAFYVARDYARVLQLIPDEAKRPSFSNLEFSRQVLRGMALAALKDRNEAGFWQELLGGSTGLWQRPLVELGLAMSWERSGRVDAVFAPGSPVTDPTLRALLLDNSAAPALLRRVAQDRAIKSDERDKALYNLLSGELSRGQFAVFAADTALPLSGEMPSAKIFSKGPFGDGAYPCASIAVSARALAANPQDNAALLCLGDFFRLHGIGDTGYPDFGPAKDELGGFTKGFVGKQLARADFYTKVIASPAARADDKAYALYRAVMCYAPSGVSECGAEAPKAQRKAWYDQLKREYPASAWAKKLRYYW
ncbi:hypothetical protein ACFFF7_02655 [Novosphingobium aquiterrae]|uniref:Outer membrane assembly lipoprotein YfiO n=1 Tax=Novosphingobium aquiterrae TaxID=624388 RepID=A0ABV6PEQ0_9SPHN